MKISRLEYNSLVWFLIRGCFVGVSLNNVLFICKQDSAIAVILAILIGFIPLAIYFYIRNYEPDLDIAEKNKLLFGKFGTILNLITALLAFTFALIILSDLTHFVGSQFLYYTPSIIIAIIFMALIVYALSKGIYTISKTSLIVFYFVIIIAFFIICGLITNIDINNFKPILYEGINPVIKSSLVVLTYNVLPAFFLLIIPKNKVNKDNTKLNIIFYLVSMLSILSMAFMTIAIFGVNMALLYEYPGFHLLRQVNIGEFVDRIEIFLSIEWIISMCIMLMICLYYVNKILKRTFKYKPKFNLIVIISEAIILILLEVYIINHYIESSSPEHDIIFYIILSIFSFIYLIIFIKRALVHNHKNYSSNNN